MKFPKKETKIFIFQFQKANKIFKIQKGLKLFLGMASPKNCICQENVKWFED